MKETTEEKQELKLYELGPDIIIAKNKRQAKTFIIKETGIDKEEADDLSEVEDYSQDMWRYLRDMDHLWDLVYLYETVVVGEFNGEVSVRLTFDEAMDDYDGDVPGIFCSTEY